MRRPIAHAYRYRSSLQLLSSRNSASHFSTPREAAQKAGLKAPEVRGMQFAADHAEDGRCKTCSEQLLWATLKPSEGLWGGWKSFSHDQDPSPSFGKTDGVRVCIRHLLAWRMKYGPWRSGWHLLWLTYRLSSGEPEAGDSCTMIARLRIRPPPPCISILLFEV